MVPNGNLKWMRAPVTVAAGTEAFGIVDRKGFDYGHFVVPNGLNTAAGAPTVIRMGHDDTVSTAVTDGTVLTAFQGGTATSSTVGFVIADESSTKGNSFEFFMDLRGLKRYVSLGFNSDGTHNGVMLASLHREKDGGIPVADIVTTNDGSRNIIFG